MAIFVATEQCDVVENQEKKAVADIEPLQAVYCTTLKLCVERAVNYYFDQLGDQAPANMYEMVLREVEQPLLATVMKRVGGNQSRASTYLGMNRGTLRKKLKQYQLT